MRSIFFKIKYEEFIPIFKELDTKLNKEAFFDAYSKAHDLINKSEQLSLNGDCLTGFKKGSIFWTEKDASKELEFEILRPITDRQMQCFESCLNILYSDSTYYNDEARYEHDSLLELVDCTLDYDRCYKKEYVSYSEYLLFFELLDIFYKKFKSKQ